LLYFGSVGCLTVNAPTVIERFALLAPQLQIRSVGGLSTGRNASHKRWPARWVTSNRETQIMGFWSTEHVQLHRKHMYWSDQATSAKDDRAASQSLTQIHSVNHDSSSS
jgi:hypothetical protein